MSAIAKKSTKITKAVFNAAKILIENGANNKEVAKYLKISAYSVSYIRNSETYEEYQNTVYEKSQRSYAKAKKNAGNEQKTEENPQVKQENPVQVVEHKQTITVQATWQMTQEMQKTNKLLESISNKLAFIVDELCGTKGGKEVD